MLSIKSARFVLFLLVAICVTSIATAESVYFVGAAPDDGAGSSSDAFASWPHDGFVFDHLVNDLEHDVYYSSGVNSTTTFGEAFDLIIISSTLGSGDVRGKFQSVTTPILHWEEALNDDDAGEFALTAADADTDNGTDALAAEITIINPDHPLAAGLPEGTFEIANSPIAQPWVRNVVDDVIQIATHPTMPDRIVLAAVEQGAELADGRESPMNLVSFFIQDSHFGELNEVGTLLFDNSIAWLLGNLNPTTPTCDFDANTVCDVVDLDALLDNLGTDNATYDLDGSGGSITLDDRNAWLSQAGQMNIGVDYVSGDTDLDGDVEVIDLNNLGTSWLSTANPGWGNGDFDGNDVVNAVDLNDLGIVWQHGVAAAAESVPEPSSGLLFLLAFVFMGLAKRR